MLMTYTDREKIDLFAFADIFDVPALRTSIVDGWHRGWDSDRCNNGVPDISDVAYAFEKLPHNSMLCTYFTYRYMQHFSAKSMDTQGFELLPAIFLSNVALGLSDRPRILHVDEYHSPPGWGNASPGTCNCDSFASEFISQGEQDQSKGPEPVPNLQIGSSYRLPTPNRFKQRGSRPTSPGTYCSGSARGSGMDADEDSIDGKDFPEDE